MNRKNILCVSEELLKCISGRTIIGILNKYGVDYYRRRGMLTFSGSRVLIALPEEISENTGTYRQIGGYIQR